MSTTRITGGHIIATLLRDNVPLTAMVAAPKIKQGRVPNGPLPVIVVKTVSVVERQALKRGATVLRTDRVSATVRAASYRDQVDIIELIKSACAGRVGDIGGGTNVSILPAGTGPDLDGPGDSFEQTQDFRVSFVAAA
ncbi:hypothetical protein ACFSTI_19650 [Rhizorhabdus histidinilytica]|uniref:DUF3168 domain-containing protein n=1 Tax=Rhizorhabdus histidinilytica TaxID=439228 RepID=A0A1T5BW58_9SPHN|nr:hypothetical protein [Rhizorhabdus histidinilytica]SKB51558.1 hypothetical protein SAMN06295920_103339 [Rhizorhabdus histidinilytica]